MNLKKVMAFILAGALMAAQVTSISAEETAVLDGVIEHDLGEQAEGEYGIMLIDEEAGEPIEEAPSYINISGVIKEILKAEDGTVSSIIVDKGEEMEVQLNISEETVLADVNGMPIDVSSLEVGMQIDAAQSEMQTMSIPPQSPALVIIKKAEGEMAPKYIEIKEIIEKDGKKAFQSEDGDYLIAFDETTEFAPYRTRNIVTAQDLKAGSKVLVWYGISTKSIPEQALATKVMILPEAVSYEEEAPYKEVVIKGAEIAGKVIDFAKYDNVIPKVENGITYLPVRALAETIGAIVTWKSQTQEIIIEAGGIKAELQIGKNTAVVAGEEVTLAAAPEIIEGRTVVGVSIDLDKYGLKLITEEK